MVRTELHRHMPLQGPKCYIPLEWTCCLLFATTMNSVIQNHKLVQWICSPRSKWILKISYLSHFSRDGASEICLIYEVVHCHKVGDFQKYAQTYYEVLNQTSLYKSIGGFINGFINRKGHSKNVLDYLDKHWSILTSPWLSQVLSKSIYYTSIWLT